MSMNRLLRDMTALIRAILPELPYLKTYRFRVVSANAGDHRWILQPISKAIGLDPIGPAEVHPGMAGLVATLPEGAEVLVEFVEGNPAMPVITAFQAPDKAGWLPTALTLDASGTVVVGPSADLVELGSGSETYPAQVADPTGRVVRWGDMAEIPGVGPVALAPQTATTVAKVKA